MPQETDKLTITYRPVGSLESYARNSRTHSDSQIDQVVASIKEFGWTNPVLIDGTKGIIAGHARVEAAKRLGLADIPCIELAGLSEAQKRAYIIADNKLGLNAGWDDELLKLEMIDLKDLNFNLESIGFDADEIERILGDNGANENLPAQHIPEQWLIIVECKDEKQQTKLLNRFASEGMKCKALIS